MSKTVTKLKFVFQNKRTARAVEQALKPDNVNFPAGLSLNQYVKGRELIIEFRSDGKVGTLVNTVDEVLASISAAVGALGGP